jgi:hypothetical protein
MSALKFAWSHKKVYFCNYHDLLVVFRKICNLLRFFTVFARRRVEDTPAKFSYLF